MNIEKSLLAILACPEDKGPLWFIESESLLYNPRTHRSFPVIDGIPVMLLEESTVVGDSEHAHLQGLIDANNIKPTFTA
jgi:uncharacterized protein YbaR (Trm112 family)